MTLGQATKDSASPGRRIRSPVWTYAPMALAGSLATADGTIFNDPLFLTVGAVFIVESLILRWFGITLTAYGAIVHNLRRRRIPWSEVQRITREPLWGTQRVVLWTPNGRQPLRAPMTQWFGLGAERFERDYHAISEFWLTYRGPDWPLQA